MNVKDKTDKFISDFGGDLVGNISGSFGTIGYKVINENRMFHIYYSKRWYNNPDGISIPKHALAVGVKESATIVVYIIDEMVWQYANDWMLLGKEILHNTLSNTLETLIKKEDLEFGEFKTQGMDNFL